MSDCSDFQSSAVLMKNDCGACWFVLTNLTHAFVLFNA